VQLAASLHPRDALVGLIVGGLVLGAAALGARLVRPRSRVAPGATGRRLINTYAAWGIGGAAVAGGVAVVLAVGRGLVRDVEPGVALAAVVAAGAGGAGWYRLARAVPLRWMVVLVILTPAGVWAAVPDTEAAVALLAAWLPFAAFGVAAGRHRMPKPEAPWIWWCALASVPAWAVAWGASAREPAVPGGLACFGVALVVPWLVDRSGGRLDVGWLIGVQLVAVVAAARWAARASTVGGGVLRGTVVVVGAALVTAGSVAISARRAGPVRPPPSGRVERPR
jgi:hypothetical protein